ncbi:hypothetical protein BGZ70_008253 [Mortierella alpina]|uniref:Uncharacterized protein n=1 Tax=Mortierella alpina TaxID=64518 RepID=A0A9P6M6P4_MORAP|nr:hypothetical protein BGZ70_008253 [Mortierella alpina]
MTSLESSPVSYSLRRQYFHPLPPPDHNTDNGAGVSPNQSSVFIDNASDFGDIKGKGKKRYTAPLESMESSSVGSRVQSRIFDQSKSIPAAGNNQLSSAKKEPRHRIRKTLSLEWSPENNALTTSVPPLRFKPKRSAALISDPSSRSQRMANDIRSTSASEQSSQRVKGPRPVPNFEGVQNQKRRSKASNNAGVANVSPEGRSLESQSEVAEQDDSNLVLVKTTSTVPKEQAQQATEQQSSATTERPSSVLVELSSHNAGNTEQLMQDVQQFVADTTPQKTHVTYPSAPILIPVPKSHLSRHRPVDYSSSSHAADGAGTLPEVPSSPVTSTSTGNKRLSNSTSRGTARRIIYSADLEQGLPEGRIARESNFEIVPSNRVSVSSRTNSSATGSKYCSRPSRFPEGVDFQDFSTATIVVQSNKRGIGRIRSSEGAQQPDKDKIATAVNTERKGRSPLPKPVDLDGMSDSDEELGAARYKAEVLKRAAEDAANAANLAAAKASAAAAAVVEAKAARLRLKNERALKIPIQAQRVEYVHHSRAVLAKEVRILPSRMHSWSMVMDHISLSTSEDQNVGSTVDEGIPADKEKESAMVAHPDSDSNVDDQKSTSELPLALQSPKALLPSSTAAISRPVRRSKCLSSIDSSRHLSETKATSAARSYQVLINGMTPEELISSIRFENDHEGTAGYYGPREYARDEENRRLQESRDAARTAPAESGSRLMPILRRVQSLAEIFYGVRKTSADEDQGTSGRT